MNVVLSADGTAEAACARDWCARHLGPDDSVIAVTGVNEFGEFVLGLPPFDVLHGEAQLRTRLEREYCAPLAQNGLMCEARLVEHGQANAVVGVARTAHADAIVVGT